MTSDFREQMLQQIRANILQHDRHIYSVMGGESPGYLYTIGMKERVGVELVLAGQVILPLPAAKDLINTICDELQRGVPPDQFFFDGGEFGRFTLGPVDPSWCKLLLLGVYDFYQCSEFRALQVVPDEETRTIDVPNMSQPFDPQDQHRVWQWIEGGWPYQVPSHTIVVTNLDALKCFAISELMRWEEDEWEMFSGAGPDIPKEEVFTAPLATLLAFDPTLEKALTVKVGTGLYRQHEEDRAGEWVAWIPK